MASPTSILQESASTAGALLVLGGSGGATGGVERYCRRLQEGFRAFSRVTLHWDALCTSWIGAESARAFVEALLAARRRARRLVASLKPERDAVWVQYGNMFDLLILRAVRKGFRGQLLCTVHVGPQWRHLRNPLTRAVAARILRRVDVVCVLSKAQESYWRDKGVLSVKRIPTLLPAWVTEDDLNSGQGRSGLLFVGRLAPEKGVEDLLRALSLLTPGTLRQPCCIVGSGSPAYMHRLQKLAADLSLSEWVRWLGLQDERGVCDLMLRCHTLVYPSSADAYPLSVLEAFAAGMQVVAYDLPGTSEILREYGGIAVRRGDVGQLATAIRSALKRHLDAGVRRKVRARYRWQEVIPRYERIAFPRALDCP